MYKQDKDKDKEDTNKKDKDKADTDQKDKDKDDRNKKDKADTDKEGRRDGGGGGGRGYGEGGGYMGEILLPLLAATRQVSRIFYTLMDIWHILFNISVQHTTDANTLVDIVLEQQGFETNRLSHKCNQFGLCNVHLIVDQSFPSPAPVPVYKQKTDLRDPPSTPHPPYLNVELYVELK